MPKTHQHTIVLGRPQKGLSDDKAAKVLANHKIEYPETTITPSDIIDLYASQGGVCALTAVRFVDGHRATTVTLINPGQPATKDNVCLVCEFVHHLKGDMSTRNFRDVIMDCLRDAEHDLIDHQIINFKFGGNGTNSGPDPAFVLLYSVYTWIKHNYWVSHLRIRLDDNKLSISAPVLFNGQFEIALDKSQLVGDKVEFTTSFFSNKQHNDSLSIVGDLVEYRQYTESSKTHAAPVTVVAFTCSLSDPTALDLIFGHLKTRINELLRPQTMECGIPPGIGQ